MNFPKSVVRITFPNNIKFINNSLGKKFNNCRNLSDLIVANDSMFSLVTNMNTAFRNCISYPKSPVCGPNVTDFSFSYFNCRSLSGPAVCGDNVVTMQSAYYQCKNLTGDAAVGNNVINMQSAYVGCSLLAGQPVCGPNVVNMYMGYWSCGNLAGYPVCGDNVRNFRQAYSHCYNLTGEPVCGPNVTDMYSSYSHCYNMTGNCYILSDNITNAGLCFEERNNTTELHLYVNKNTLSYDAFMRNDYMSITGTTMNWTKFDDSTQFSLFYNIYLHAVDNVREYYK